MIALQGQSHLTQCPPEESISPTPALSRSCYSSHPRSVLYRVEFSRRALFPLRHLRDVGVTSRRGGGYTELEEVEDVVEEGEEVEENRGWGGEKRKVYYFHEVIILLVAPPNRQEQEHQS
ncbi:hypothetical protein BgiBS90_026317, partial [Biomphalaria glabrata]